MDHDKNKMMDSDEVALKDIFLKIKEFTIEVLNNWKLLLVFIIPFAAYFLVKAFLSDPTYSARLTFMINEEEGGGASGASTLLNQFGLGKGGGGNYNMEKILELSKSRKIVQNTLFDSMMVNGHNDLIANHIIDIYNLHDEWKKSSLGKNKFKFTRSQPGEFNRTENTVLLKLYRKIIGNETQLGLFSKSLNEDTGIMTLSSKTTSEELSIKLLNSIYNNLSAFYIDKAIEKQRFNLNLIAAKTDSIKNALNIADYNLANFRDSNRGLWTKKAELREDQLSREVQILTIMYGESIKNLEYADFSLRTKTPFIQLVDAPISPIPANMVSKVMAFAIGVFIGAFLGIAFIIARKVFRDIMS